LECCLSGSCISSMRCINFMELAHKRTAVFRQKTSLSAEA
jgi:hypothetical protein